MTRPARPCNSPRGFVLGFATMTPRRVRPLLFVLLLLAALAHGFPDGRHAPTGSPGYVPGYELPFTTECWYEPHYFDSLRTGPIEYCRKNLRYRPGALECLTISDRVCTLWYPDRREWGESRISGEARLMRCPAGDEPPTCPRLNVGRTSGSWRR